VPSAIAAAAGEWMWAMPVFMFVLRGHITAEGTAKGEG